MTVERLSKVEIRRRLAAFEDKYQATTDEFMESWITGALSSDKANHADYVDWEILAKALADVVRNS